MGGRTGASSTRPPSPMAGTGGACRCGAASTCLGAFVLADRVNGAVYTLEELALLTCVGDHDDVGAG